MKAEDRDLKFAIDYALREIYRSGTYEELYLAISRWGCSDARTGSPP